MYPMLEQKPMGQRSYDHTRSFAVLRRVLIADDSLLMRQTIADILAADGWTVVAEAGNGREAIDFYKRYRPDAVTMDIIMPGMGGIEALVAIVEYDPQAKVVVVSALNQTPLISEAIRKGAQDFIAKPFTPAQLCETMRAMADAVDALVGA
jgi:two-component system, chemotaxis family, chemotaxis protein CheY